MNFNIQPHTIYLTVSGSRGYGLQTAISDYDVSGIAIPPKEYFLGLNVFEQTQFKSLPFSCNKENYNQEDPVEGTIYDIRKFFRLASEANPNILDILYTRDSDILVCTDVGTKIRSIRDKFLSKKVKYTYSGYACSQLQRIRTHRRWLINPPTHKPTREEFGLPENKRLLPQDQLEAVEALIRKQVDIWMGGITDLPEDDARFEIGPKITEIISLVFEQLYVKQSPSGYTVRGELENAAIHQLGFDDNFMEYIFKERDYKTALNQWNQYQNWLATRNEARAELERKFGYDTKHAMHLVRLLRMAREILAYGEVRVFRQDAEELLAIRRGAWSYEELIQFTEGEDKALEEVMKQSSLPSRPNRELINKTVQEVVEEFLWRKE